MSSTTTKATTLSLYRSILRSHSKSLPPQMKALGDAYVQAEFRLHQNVTKQDQLNRFFKEWRGYLNHIEETARARDSRSVMGSETKNVSGSSSGGGGESEVPLYSFGKDMKIDVDKDLNEEQKIQLTKLREEASKVSK